MHKQQPGHIIRIILGNTSSDWPARMSIRNAIEIQVAVKTCRDWPYVCDEFSNSYEICVRGAASQPHNTTNLVEICSDSSRGRRYFTDTTANHNMRAIRLS